MVRHRAVQPTAPQSGCVPAARRLNKMSPMNLYDQPLNPRTDFLKTDSPKLLLALNAALAIVYFFVLTFFFPLGNPILFWMLIAGEVFHIWQVLTFIYTVW